MERVDIFQKLKRQEAEAFSKLTAEERLVITQYQDRCKAPNYPSETDERRKFQATSCCKCKCRTSPAK